MNSRSRALGETYRNYGLGQQPAPSKTSLDDILYYGFYGAVGLGLLWLVGSALTETEADRLEFVRHIKQRLEPKEQAGTLTPREARSLAIIRKNYPTA